MANFSFTTLRPHLLTAAEMDLLIQIVGKPFRLYASDSTDEDIRSRLVGNGASYVELAFMDGIPCGFSAWYTKICDDCLVNYRGGTSLVEEARGHGLYKQLIQRGLDTDDFDYIATRTQNPAVYESLSRFAAGGVIYPNPEQAPPFLIRQIAFATSESGVVEPDTLIVRDAHDFVVKDRSFMACRSDQIRRFFAASLGPDDGFMVVAALT
jgi:hypothetical protein